MQISCPLACLLFYLTCIVINNMGSLLQWDLFIKDTLGPANLSTVERLLTLQR